jgi:23S rRNA (uracil1939-C5)-methyltransferase
MLHAVPRPSTLELDVAALAPGGDGVSHTEIEGERRAVFVPHTVPGDRVRARVDASRRPARGQLLELLAAGPDRTTPACAWSTRCGGCDWMHVAPEAQVRAHVEHVRAALPERWRDSPVTPREAPRTTGYRTRARVHVRCERGRVEVGMHEARTHDPVAVDVCVVLDPAVENARRSLAAWLEESRGRGEAQIALGVERRPVLELRWQGEVAPAAFARLERAVLARELAGARVALAGAKRPAVVGDPTPWIVGADDRPLRLAPGGFAQASEPMNATLAGHVAGQVRPLGVDRAVELYAGSGNLSVLLARDVRELVLVESNPEACEAARANLAARDLAGRVVESNAEEYAWSAATKLLVLDPPRTGARLVAERLARSRVPHVVYVSCDPATLGRDLAILAAAYAPRSIATFEMFPQTSHVETVVVLERGR